jgi:lipopolysaccharide export system permease protein
MKVLTRYLLRAHLGPFLFAFGALTGVILINTLARQLADLAGKGLPMDVVLQFFVLSLPSNIALTLPMAVLVSVLYTFSQLTAENEIMALKASGIDLRRLVLPLLLVAGLIAGGMIWFNDRVLPESNHQWRQLMGDIARKSPLFTLREQRLNMIRTGDGMSRYYLRAAQIDPTTNRLRDVSIFDVSDPRIGRTIYADSGTMAFNTTRTDLLLTLYNGHLRELNFSEPAQFQRVVFREQVLRMEGVGNELERQTGSDFRGDREMTIAMMGARVDTLRAELARVRAEAVSTAATDLGRALGSTAAADSVADPLPGGIAEAGTLLEGTREAAQRLRTAADRTSSLERQIREFRVEVQKKYSIAAATLVFVLIGMPLALRFPQGGIGMVIAVSLGVFALYYVGLIGGETLADSGYVSPAGAMWAMNALFGVLGLVGLLRMGREQRTARGGSGGGFRALFGRRERTPAGTAEAS